nr:hypothetical protein [Halopseudomonas yangmingensis]
MLRFNFHVRLRLATAVQGDAGLDHSMVVQLVSLNKQSSATDKTSRDINLFAGMQFCLALGIPLSQVDSLPTQMQIAQGGQAAKTQLAIGIDVHIACAGGHIAGQPHAHTMLGSHQANAACIHAAKCRTINSQQRLVATICSLGCRNQRVSIHLVASGNDVQLVGVQFCIDFGTAGNQVELINVGGIDSSAINDNLALIHIKTAQLPIFNDGFTGTQNSTGGIDEAATVTGYAVGVGHDHTGTLPGNLGIAFELTGVAACHLIQNKPCGTASQVRVGVDIPPQLRSLNISGIVENQALLTYVVFNEAVVRQTTGVWRGNIDHRYTVSGLPQACITCGCAIYSQIRRQADQRVERQYTNQQGGDVLEQGAVHIHGLHSLVTNQKNRSKRK